MKKQLNVRNLVASYYDASTEKSDLEFDVNGKKVFLIGVDTPKNASEYYFDNEELLSNLAATHEIEILN